MFVTDWSPNQDFSPVDPTAELICLRVVTEGWTPPWLATLVARYTPLVSPGEAAQAARFRRQEDCLRHLLGRAALRAMLASLLERPLPRDQEFSMNTWGKPGLPDALLHSSLHPPLRFNLHFNLSHGGEEIWLACSAAGPVGVDVEPLRTLRSADVVSLFHPGEQAALARDEAGHGPDGGQSNALLRCWVRKEAVIKAQGQGLSLGLDSFEVRTGGTDTDWLRQPPAHGAGVPGPGWTTADLPTPPGVFAAVAAMAPGLRLRLGELRWVPDGG